MNETLEAIGMILFLVAGLTVAGLLGKLFVDSHFDENGDYCGDHCFDRDIQK